MPGQAYLHKAPFHIVISALYNAHPDLRVFPPHLSYDGRQPRTANTVDYTDSNASAYNAADTFNLGVQLLVHRKNGADICGSISRPYSVSSIPVLSLFSRGKPNSFSSFVKEWLTAEAERFISPAARRRFPVVTIKSKIA